MLAIARAVMAPSKLLLVDELSIGLGPSAIARVYAALRVLRDSGVTILLGEENVARIADFASRVYLLDHGQIVAETTPFDLSNNEMLRKTYFG
jgi:branched-chain amino acid transport system ATP-binding protein